MKMVAKGRSAKEIPSELRDSSVSVRGTVNLILSSNPFTQSTNYNRNKRFLLNPVFIAGEEYDHVWIQGCSRTIGLKIGDKVSFFAKLGTYESAGKKKWKVKIPYKDFRHYRDVTALRTTCENHESNCGPLTA